MLTQFTTVFSSEGINIAHMTNKSRGDYSYCIFDIDSDSTEAFAQKLSAIDGVLKVRIIKERECGHSLLRMRCIGCRLQICI